MEEDAVVGGRAIPRLVAVGSASTDHFMHRDLAMKPARGAAGLARRRRRRQPGGRPEGRPSESVYQVERLP